MSPNRTHLDRLQSFCGLHRRRESRATSSTTQESSRRCTLPLSQPHQHSKCRDGRPPPGVRTVRSILSRPMPDSVKVTDVQPSYPANNTTPTVDGETEDAPDGYQLNALRRSFPESSDDFDLCFQAVDLQSCTTPDATTPFFESVCGDDVPFDIVSDIPSVDSDSFLFRRLSETYDPNSRAIYAHAENGSMACTTSDSSLLVLL